MSSFCVHGFPLCGPVAGGSAGHSLGSPELASEAFRCLLPIGSRKLTKKCLSEPYGRSGRKGTRSDRVTRQLANRAAISGAGVGSRRPGRRGSRPWIEAVAARRTRAAAQAPAPATAAVQPNRSNAHRSMKQTSLLLAFVSCDIRHRCAHTESPPTAKRLSFSSTIAPESRSVLVMQLPPRLKHADARVGCPDVDKWPTGCGLGAHAASGPGTKGSHQGLVGSKSATRLSIYPYGS